MQKIESRKWISNRETFDNYATEKLALMNRLDLPVTDSIHLLIGGISQTALRATALSIQADTVENFLEKMRHITEGLTDVERKMPFSSGLKAKDAKEVLACRNCGKKGHSHRECRGEATCFYCKSKGHRQFDCPAKKKQRATGGASQVPAASVAAAVTTDQETSSVGAVQEAATEPARNQLIVSSPFVEVCSLGSIKCKLIALIDTGSPVSFVKYSVYQKFIESCNSKLDSPEKTLRNLSNHVIDILGIARSNISLSCLDEIIFAVKLYVMKDNMFESDFILGRDFLAREGLIFVYSPSAIGEQQAVNLFSELPLCIDENSSENILERQHNR